jgi:EAL domain-containing protein (putative c-di-GMP-specific phosphodiesterase class I)
VRWNHPTQGLLYPDSFIQVAEETGLINPLGQWVLETACKHRREMARRGFAIDWLSVNISARQFQHPDFFEHTKNSLQEHCSSSGGLKLELTESALMENTSQAIDTLNRLKALGVGLCIDDFGTGYSSLAYLKQFPVDTLKVDRSFVTDIPNDNSDMEITAAIIAMAHKLGMEVVAEGIETEQQLAFLQLNRCALGQGYLFRRPMPMESLIRLNPTL